MTLANRVTLGRLCLIPLVLLSLAWGQQVWSAWWLFVFLVGDVLDGYLARSRGQITELGKFLDPLADKLMAFGLLVWYAATGKLSSWAVVLLVVQNVVLLGGTLLLARRHGRTLASRFSGKLSALVLWLGLILLYLDRPSGAGVIYLGVGLAYLALLDYAHVARRMALLDHDDAL